MAFGKEWDKEKKLASENGGDAEKMLQLYIYNHLKKKNLHDVAEIYAKEANLETSQLVEPDENLLTEWWGLFWPTFCSRLSNKVGANAQPSGQPSTGNSLAMLASLKNQGASSTRQTPMVNPQQNVLPEIPTTGMNQLFAGNTPIIPNFANIMPGNQASNLLPPLEMDQLIIGCSDLFDNVIAQSPADLLSTAGGNQRRTDKLPVNTLSDNIIGGSAAENLLEAQTFRKDYLGFPPVESLLSQTMFGANDMLYTTPPSGSQSHLQLPATVQAPAHVIMDPKNDALGRHEQMEPTRPAGPNSVYTTVEHHAGEDNRASLMPLTEGGVSDGLDPVSSRTHVPASFFLLMQQEVQRYRVDTSPPSPPPNRTSQEVQEGSETTGIGNDLGSVGIEFPCQWVTEWNDPYSAYGSAVPEGKESGVNNDA